MSRNKNALVLFSGGQDSTTCLAWALEKFDRVETIGFAYGQRHSIELECRPALIAMMQQTPQWKHKLSEDHVLDLGILGEVSQTALTREIEIEISDKELPNTYVPGRNIIFLTFAAAIAYRRGIEHIVTGVCETDYSGYPDCRDDTIKAMKLTLNLGMEARFVLHTPLMWIDKAQTWAMAEDLWGEDFVSLIKESAHTCYNGNRESRYDWGYGCSTCPACVLRKQGYETFMASKVP